MRKLGSAVVMLVLVALLAAPVAAQDKEKKKGKRGQQRGQRGVAAQLMKKLEAAKLTDEQKGKVKKIVAKYEPKLKEMAEALKPKPGQREAVAAARKKAEAEGKKGKEARDAITAAMKLTDEQKEMRKKQQKLQQEMQKAVLAVLTPEQLKIVRPDRKRGGADKSKRKAGKTRKKSDK